MRDRAQTTDSRRQTGSRGHRKAAARRPALRNPQASGILASIVIVSYNSRRDLGACLNSVLFTTGRDREVVVVDNASTDGSAQLVSELYPWVKLVRSPRNEGFAAGSNRGAAAAAGRYLVFLNPDTEVAPGWLEALLGPLQAGAEESWEPVGLTTPRILMMPPANAGGDRVNTCGNVMHYTGITTCRGLNRPAGAPELSERCDVPAVSGACFAMPRKVWERLGGLDETYFTYLEDTDISMRARLAGYRCLYVPEAVVYHRYGGDFSARKLYYLERNRIYMLLKLYGTRTLRLLVPALLLAEAVAWGYALKSGPAHVRAKLHAYRWLLSHRDLIGRRRRQLALSHSEATWQSRRKSDAELLELMGWRLDMEQLAGPVLGRIAGALRNPAFHLWHRFMLAYLGRSASVSESREGSERISLRSIRSSVVGRRSSVVVGS